MQQQPPQVVFLADGTPVHVQTPAPGGYPVVPYPHPPVPAPVVHPAYPVPAAAPLDQVQVSDPWPARLLCGGIGIGAAGVGIGFLLQALAAATTGLALLLGVLAVVWVLKDSVGGRGAVNVTVTNRNR